MKTYRVRKRVLLSRGRPSVYTTAGLLALSMALGVAYVYLGCCCQILGQEIQRLENEVEQERERWMREEYEWACLIAPDRLEAALARHGLAMTWPRSEQIVRLQVRPAIPTMVADRRGRSAPTAQRIWHE